MFVVLGCLCTNTALLLAQDLKMAEAVARFRLRQLRPLLQATGSKAPVSTPKFLNPFLPHKNPETMKWAPSQYSLRQQADLIKQARQSNLVHLLPPGPKLTLAEIQRAREQATTVELPDTYVRKFAHVVGPVEGKVLAQSIEWKGEAKEKVVPGADVGNRLYATKKRMFKGHKWERAMEKRENKRKILLESMPERIQRFRTVRGMIAKLLCYTYINSVDIQEETSKSSQCTAYIQVPQASILITLEHFPLSYRLISMHLPLAVQNSIDVILRE